MSQYARLASPLVTQSVDRGIALLRWSGFWCAIALPALHVPLLVVEGFTASTTPVILLLWLANVVALLLGRHHRPRRTRSPAGGDHR